MNVRKAADNSVDGSGDESVTVVVNHRSSLNDVNKSLSTGTAGLYGTEADHS